MEIVNKNTIIIPHGDTFYLKVNLKLLKQPYTLIEGDEVIFTFKNNDTIKILKETNQGETYVKFDITATEMATYKVGIYEYDIYLKKTNETVQTLMKKGKLYIREVVHKVGEANV